MPKSTTASARERELFRYYQPCEQPGAYEHDGTHLPRSSSDPCLTAFTQLGALRLDASRGFIALFSRETEYVLAESGKYLSLQKDNDESDPLWHGVGTLKEGGMGKHMMEVFCASESTVPYMEYSDLSSHESFKDLPHVAGHPHVRFFASVPLRTQLNSIVIGAYIVLGDKPRHGLSEEEILFLTDMSVTVMDYLEAARVNQKEYRAQRMVKAIGLFIEGKSSLRHWWLEAGHKILRSKVRKRVLHGDTLDDQADAEFGIQDPPDEYPANDVEELPYHELHQQLHQTPLSATFSQIDGRDWRPRGDSFVSGSDATILSSLISRPGIDRTSSVTTVDTVDDMPPDPGARDHSITFESLNESILPDVSKGLQEAVLSNNLKTIFARASNLIREANGVDGVIFYDASVVSFGRGSEKKEMNVKAPSGFVKDGDTSTSGDDFGRGSSDTDAMLSAKKSMPMSGKFCDILGYSTRKRSSLLGHTPPEDHLRFAETVLRALLKRYPQGKVFNFDEGGSFSSSDTDQMPSGIDLPFDKRPQRMESVDWEANQKNISREAEAAAILRAIPGARSVFWFPLWDQNRERWHSGSLVWSTCATRILCPMEDLTYLVAFGNSIMAEVGRLSAQVLSQMKTDFISSISHELRSPLHGVLASVEFLQETDMTEAQADMVNNIHASGKVLLDTVNHVLDFSKVNRRSRDKGRRSKKSRRYVRGSGKDCTGSVAAGIEASDVCVLSEEVIESVYAGRNIGKLVLDASTGRNLAKRRSSFQKPIELPVTVIVDIRWRPNRTFDVDAGAWRRILMNLFSNALKYTKSGFIGVSLQVEDRLISRTKKPRPILVLKVKDSGKGISQDFLKYQLYKPFTQEDSLCQGTGLGLSIVRQIVQDLAGKIDFTSEQGIGTEVTVQIPLVSTTLSAEMDGPDYLTEVRKKSKGLKFLLEGFDCYPDLSQTPTGILPPETEAVMFLRSSVHSLLTDWFAMKLIAHPVSENDNVDVLVLMESGVSSLERKLHSYYDKKSILSKTLVIILGTYPQKLNRTSHPQLQVRYIQQPCGPHKIARLLYNVFSQDDRVIADPKLHGLQISDRDPKISPKSIQSHEKLEDRSRNDSDILPQESRSIRILLVEDNEINLKLLVAYMRKLNLYHATAVNGLEALNAYKEAEGQFDVIFMDISMPIMSGIESARQIRKYEQKEGLCPAAIIALTGAANPNTRQEAFSSGIDLFLTKPVSMKELKLMIEDFKINGRKGLIT